MIYTALVLLSVFVADYVKNNLGIIVFLYFLTFLNLLLDIYSLIFYLTLKKKFDFFYNIDNQVSCIPVHLNGFFQKKVKT